MRIDTDPRTALSGITSESRHLIACGFPWSGELFCSNFTHRHQFAFGIAGQGYLYPGMSGGPVIDTDTLQVIGVNSAVINGSILVSPIIEIFRALNIKPD